jgi:hypothetical protein
LKILQDTEKNKGVFLAEFGVEERATFVSILQSEKIKKTENNILGFLGRDKKVSLKL